MWLEVFMAVTVQSSFMTYHRVCSQINTTGVHSGAGTAYRSVAPEFTPGFQWGTGTRYSIFSFMCMFCRSLFVLCTFSFDHCVVCSSIYGGPGGSMSQVAGSNSSYKPITNTAWVRARLCKLQKRCTRLAAASDKVYQLFAHGRWFSPGTPASSTTKTGRHDIAEILLKVALKHQKSKSSQSSIYGFSLPLWYLQTLLNCQSFTNPYRQCVCWIYFECKDCEYSVFNFRVVK